MIQRCHNPKSSSYARYGGRGIVVCDRWRSSVAAFLADMGERPAGMSIDRLDNDGPYSPDNCRWATPSQQARNTHRTRHFNVGKKVVSLPDAADMQGVTPVTLHMRLRRGWSQDMTLERDRFVGKRAITINGETLTMAQWAKRLGISRQAVHQRIKAGWPMELALSRSATPGVKP